MMNDSFIVSLQISQHTKLTNYFLLGTVVRNLMFNIAGFLPQEPRTEKEIESRRLWLARGNPEFGKLFIQKYINL